METASLYAIGSATAAIAGSPASTLVFEWLANWYHKKRLSKRVRGLILLKGVTSMCQKLTSPECVYIDCDCLYQTLTAPKSAEDVAKPANVVDDLLSFSIIKKHILNITSVFKGKIILVSKNPDLLKSLPLKSENIFFAAFSRDMEENIGVIFPNEAEHHAAEIAKYRIMRELDEERMFLNDNLKELYENVCKKFDSKKVML
jgi:hypothetical protein